MSVSFGVEFEFFYIKRENGGVITEHNSYGDVRVDGWKAQYDDWTCGWELDSPPYTSIEEAIENLNKQWQKWYSEVERRETVMGIYARNTEHSSIGQHLHVGKSDRRLGWVSKKKIGFSVGLIYPLLMGIHANPIPSKRGLESQYCSSIQYYNWDFPNSDHYCEISNSNHGTVEFRVFDANVPQASLSVAAIITKVAEKSLRKRLEELNFFADRSVREQYKKDRKAALTYGLKGLNVRWYLERVKEFVGNMELPPIDSIREVWFLVAKYGINIGQLYDFFTRVCNLNGYQYFREMFTKTESYLENLMPLLNNKWARRLKGWKEEVTTIEKIGDLIELTENVQKAISKIIPRGEKITRSEVRQRLERGIIEIGRVRNFGREMCEQVSYLLTYHGNGNVEALTPQEVRDRPERYYVLVVNNRALATIGLQVRTGELMNLTVDRRMRRLGVATRLLRWIIREAENLNVQELIARIPREDTIRRMLEGIGFQVREERENDIEMVMRLREE